MPVTVNNQAHIFLCAVFGGMLMALLYDLFRIRRKALKTNLILLYAEDFLYWLLVALIMFGVAYFGNEGELRGYIFLGVLIGVILYILLLSKIVIASSMFAINIIRRVLKAIWAVVTYPFRITYLILRIPMRKLFGVLRKFFRGLKNILKNQVVRQVNLKRAIRNIIKKT